MIRFGRKGDVALVLVCLLLAGAYLRRPLHRYNVARRSRIGTVAITGADSVMRLTGERVGLLSTASMSLLVMVDPQDPETREKAAQFGPWAHWIGIQGLGMHLLVGAHIRQATEFSHATGIDSVVADPDGTLRQRLGLAELPSVLLLDSGGVVRARWIGEIPTRLAILNALQQD